MSRYYNQNQYFQGPKDQIIQTLQTEIYELKSKIGNYDILRKNMIELELTYRDLMVEKSNSEARFKGDIGQTQGQNVDMRKQINNVKEQVHLLTLKNNQVASEIKRQKAVNVARQDELASVDQECRRRDDEAMALKRENSNVLHDTNTNRAERDRQDMDNSALATQVGMQEDQARQLRSQIKNMQAELASLKDTQRAKDTELRKREIELQRKKDALISSQTEMRRIELELQECQNEQVKLTSQHRSTTDQNRKVEKNFYAESKRQEDLESQVKALKFEVDQLTVRKASLVTNTDKLSEALRGSIERTDMLRAELSAVQNLVQQYELANQRIIDEMEQQAAQNEDIVNQLQRKTRVTSMKEQMERDLHASAAKFPAKKAETENENLETFQN